MTTVVIIMKMNSQMTPVSQEVMTTLKIAITVTQTNHKATPLMITMMMNTTATTVTPRAIIEVINISLSITASTTIISR